MILPPPIDIVGFAACSSLGFSLEANLAAMGAGLSNFTETTVANEFGHRAIAASLLGTDADRGERLAALVRHGLEDALSRLLPVDLRNIRLLVGAASDLTDAEQQALLAAINEKLPTVAEVRLFLHGRASTFAALTAAIDFIRTGSDRAVLVAGIDSLCGPAQLRRLVNDRRLLSPLTDGTIPGEAAAFALLARADDAIADPATSVRLHAVALQRAAIPFTKAQVVSGDALAAVFRTFRESGAERVHRVIAAHSGEGYFGRSFAHAYLREVEVMPQPLSVESIADRVGDVGAAAGVLGLAFSVYLMVNDGRDDEARALVYSESDTGEVGGAILGGAPKTWRRRLSLHAVQ